MEKKKIRLTESDVSDIANETTLHLTNENGLHYEDELMEYAVNDST